MGTNFVQKCLWIGLNYVAHRPSSLAFFFKRSALLNCMHRKNVGHQRRKIDMSNTEAKTIPKTRLRCQ